MYVKNSKIWPHTNKLTTTLLIAFNMPANCLASSNLDSLLELSISDLMNVTVVSLFDETLIEASSSVKVVNETGWQGNGARRTNEIMAYQPATISHPFLGGSNAFSIRGYANTLSARGMATLLDGVPLNTYSFGTAQYFLANFDLGTLNRAELIRGPGSAIYGSDAFHGVFSLSTYTSNVDSVEAELGAGSPEYARGHVRFSQQLGERSRISGGAASTIEGDSDIVFDTSAPGIQGEREDAFASKTGYLKAEHKLSDQWEAEWGVYYNSWDGESFPSFGESTLGKDDLSNNEQEFFMLKANVKHKLSQGKSVELKSFIWNTDQRFDYQFVPVPFQQQEDRRYGMSVIIKDEGNEKRDRWLIGAGLDRTKIISTSVSTGVQAFDGQERKISNLFADYRFTFPEADLLLGIGARLDDYADFGSHFTPRLSLIYLLNESEAVKLLYGNAFRAPVGSEVTSSGVIQGNMNLKPETIDTYELIWMKQTAGYSITTTAFYSEWTDGIVIVDDATLPVPFTRRYENQGKLRSQGIELESTMLLNQWRMDGAYSFIESEDMQKQEDFIAFPRHVFQFGAGTGVSAKLNFRFYNTVYADVHASPVQTAKKLGTIWQTNMHLNYQWSKHTELSVDIRDILNRKDPVPSLWGNEQGIPVDGIQISAYLQYDF